ncbi:NAD(P)-dependent dehydrogenase (short-subunit alcohol dehydrogenase family) [Haloactinospora alba]|uniref:NAD(P)-dependent dehydrogenase (Short-subunit alcohol dehydrogenase family) n=1 Tax=Haloactinospora alba TaxID=405555 RepID=A0A543N756_9ACTN|nr:SDR family oxidoreductase [Haloactinospora alba]TQN27640.1 NAD(P)-dependent dehydrogenase (short-subunit alcohol dehydrogenase family) [Haloactinospora alba]
MGTPLAHTTALVAGATRGAGRAIAVELGALGATVYCTGRSTEAAPSDMARPETIEGTARRVTEAGGQGVAVPTDHLDPQQVAALVRRVDTEQGALDVLVNDVWGGDPLAEWDARLWEHDLENGRKLLRRAVDTHIITSHHALPLLTRRPGGLVLEITDGTDRDTYRGSFFYDLAKDAVIRMAQAQAAELGPLSGTAVALTPGFLRSEAMLDIFGVTEENWREATAKEPHFCASESPAYVGRAAAALAADPDVGQWNGRAVSSWAMAGEYGFTDADGTRPDWGRYMAEVVLTGATPSDEGYR